MSRAPTVTRPLSNATNPQIARNNVVLPQPEAPRRATNWPASARSETSSSTGCAP